MQFTERSPLLLGLIAIGLIAAVTVVALTLGRSDLGDGFELTAQFEDAAGLRVGDDVFVAGVRVGEVLDIEIVEDRIETTLQVQGADVPAQSRAEIKLRTLVGSRGIEVTTGDDFTDLLSDGDVIPLEQTSVATDVPEFGDETEELLTEVDSEALNTFFASVTDVTEGQRDEVSALIDGGTRLAEVVSDQETQIRRLLRSLREVSSTVSERDEELIAIIDEFSVVFDRLVERRDEVRRLLRETNATSAEAADLVGDTRAELDAILDEVHADVEILQDRQVALAETLAYAPDGVGGFASVTYSGDEPVDFGKVFTTSLGPAGVDVLVGCGGLVDQQLDAVLGEDPRPCDEQTNPQFDDEEREHEGESQTPVPDLLTSPRPESGSGSDGEPRSGSGSGSASGPPLERAGLDAVGRRLLPDGEGDR